MSRSSNCFSYGVLIPVFKTGQGVNTAAAISRTEMLKAIICYANRNAMISCSSFKSPYFL
jgi:hypothetical protein